MAVSHTVPGGTAAGTAVAYRLLTHAYRVPTADAGFALAIRGIGSAVVLNVSRGWPWSSRSRRTASRRCTPWPPASASC